MLSDNTYPEKRKDSALEHSTSARITVKQLEGEYAVSPTTQGSKTSEDTGPNLYAAHEKIYPREFTGKYQTIRRVTVLGVLAAFYGLAWIDWSDRQAILFDLPARQFSIFSVTFWPQDFYLLTLCLIIASLSLFAATALAGRLWCGYACPQTVWTELFLWIERLTEGTYNKRRKLDAAPWSTNKALRKTLKQALWISLALWTGFTFVGYFTPIKSLAHQALSLDFGGWEWFWILFYGLATYGNAGFLREQVCQYMCPYARFQSAMLDPHSLVISYDAARGEPRKSISKNGAAQTPKNQQPGDCIDCKICVQVCPTDIDIRDGLQYECIGCAACIDACNNVMRKINKPTGLIRYSSEHALARPNPSQQIDAAAERKLLIRNIFRPRMLIYGTLWLLLITGLMLSLWLRSPTVVDIIRDRQTFYQLVAPGYVDNVYTLKIMNKLQVSQKYSVSIAQQQAAQVLYQPSIIEVPAGEMVDLPVRLRMPLDANKRGAQSITFLLHSQNTLGREKSTATESKTSFWYPINS
jgi:cytochrome c oxidase accessory protein FixG